jgi:hypothetical protein
MRQNETSVQVRSDPASTNAYKYHKNSNIRGNKNSNVRGKLTL